MAYSDGQPQSDAERLFVLSGELRGVSVPLDEGTFRVGSDTNCDVILLSNEETPAEVSFTSSNDTKLSIADPIGNVRVGRKTLHVGKRLVVKSGVPVMVGDTKLMVAESFDAAGRAEQVLSRRFTRMTYASLVLVAVGVAGIYGLTGGRGVVAAKPGFITDQTSVHLDFVSAATATQRRLDTSNLSHISALADNTVGTVKVRGRLRESEKTSWKKISTWFDATYGGSIMLDAQLDSVASSVTLPFSISAVWVGQRSRLTLHDGSQRYSGELLPGGWILEKVTPNQITISKDGESLIVPL